MIRYTVFGVIQNTASYHLNDSAVQGLTRYEYRAEGRL